MYMSFGSPTIMRTRRETYPSASDGITYTIRPSHERKRRALAEAPIGRAIKLKRVSSSTSKKQSSSLFDLLHEDLLLLIFSALSASTTTRADLVNTMLVCKRFCATATHPQVLAKASSTTLSVTAKGWSDGALRFLKQCADAGNIEACYTLGMIRFYCLANRQGGASLMAKAAMQSHAAALHSLAVIQFNGSGGTRKDKDLKAGVALCVRAATLGHVDAMRELGHCLQDGYGVTRNPQEGRRLLVEANAREAAAAVFGVPSSCIEASQHLNSTVMRIRQNGQNQSPSGSISSTETLVSRYGGSRGSPVLEGHQMFKFIQGGSCPLSSDFGCPIPPKLHISNQFMVDWFDSRLRPPGLRLCSHRNCGRPETRRHEFRRCSACGTVNYCSRACQALDWKIHHKYDCNPVPDWEERQDQDAEEDDQIAFEDVDES